MQIFNTYHLHQFNKVMHSDFWLFEFSIWLHVLARSLIAVFVPVLMLIIGFTLQEVLLFYFIFHILDVIFCFTARWFVCKYGARMAMIIANVSIISFFLLLSQLSIGEWGLLIIMAVILAIYDAFFWVSHIYLFIESGKESGKSSKNTSVLYIVKQVAGLLSPAIGAAILIFYSENILIFVSVVIFSLSIIPLVKAKNLPDRPQEKILCWREFFKDKKDRINYVLFTTYTLHRFNEQLLWPIFIFIIIGTIESVALVPVIVSITAIFFSYLAGKANVCSQRKSITICAIIIAIMWIMRLNFDNHIFLYASIFIVGIFSIFIDLPLDSNIFSRGKVKNPVSVAMWRNVFSMGIRIPILGILLLVVNVFNISFIIAIVGLILLIFFQIFLMYKYIDPECVKY